jgi:hypothetical protein
LRSHAVVVSPVFSVTVIICAEQALQGATEPGAAVDGREFAEGARREHDAHSG